MTRAKELRARLAELVRWVNGYALDDMKNDRYYTTGGADIIDRAQQLLDQTKP